jgi:hypothetical protein
LAHSKGITDIVGFDLGLLRLRAIWLEPNRRSDIMACIDKYKKTLDTECETDSSYSVADVISNRDRRRAFELIDQTHDEIAVLDIDISSMEDLVAVIIVSADN